MRILIIEDDRETAHYLFKSLSEAGYVPDKAEDGEQGYEMALSTNYDAMIIDRMLPKRDGLSIISALREENNKTPALILSALGQVDDRVEGLRAGGDDYLTKPFAFSELLARLEALIRRFSPASQQMEYTLANLTMNRMARTVKRNGHNIILQPREFRLLEYLMANANRVVTRTMLLEKVWDYHFDPQTNVIDVHISRLRAKIDKDFSPSLLHTIRGAGYMLSDQTE